MSEAIDEFYNRIGSVKGLKESSASVKIKKLEKLQSELTRLISENKNIASLVMSRITDLEKAMERVRRGESYVSYDGLLTTNNVNWTSRKVEFTLGKEGFLMDMDIRPGQNASRKFETAKKLTQRLREVEKELLTMKQKPAEEAIQVLKKRPTKEWFEKFRWGYTSAGKMILAGRDHVTNEILLNKYCKIDTVVFHSDFSGAPFVAVPDAQLSEDEKRELAEFAASYTSKAWNSNFSSLDVFWVLREQLSKSPPSGEYLAKGAFSVRGSRNYIRSVALRLGVTLKKQDEGGMEVIVSSPESVSKFSNLYFVVEPGNTVNRKIAHRIALGLCSKMGLRYEPYLTEEILSRLPGRKSSISPSSRT
jgi:predicted ribosome quality control (RQC) complex YloA/Tae2 family protein